MMPTRRRPRRVSGRELARIGAEVVVAVAVATAVVALLQPSTPPVRLEALYLLAVLAVAIRRGELAALATAILSGLVVNYQFLTPRHELAIAHSQDVVELVVLLIAAVVVGRLAATSRQRAAEAETRAGEAASREREARLLAEVASAILTARSLPGALQAVAQRVRAASGAAECRVSFDAVPDPGPGELALPLPAGSRPLWLFVSADRSWPRQDLERLAEPLGRLLAVAIERERLAEVAAEAEAGWRADQARRAILHALSHDLRSPLTAITTAGSALRSASLDDSERDELLDVIALEGARLGKLMGDLLDLSRIQAGAVAPQADWCDLGDIVASAVAGLRTSHEIAFTLPADLPLVRADAVQLERVFSNLIENAIKSSPPDRAVRISAGVGASRVTVRVIDRGRGIPPADRARVFEPFFRSRGASGSGSGLGLAICRGFVEANGGQIRLQTGARETAFAVSFPLEVQPSGAPDRRLPDPVPSAS